MKGRPPTDSVVGRLVDDHQPFDQAGVPFGERGRDRAAERVAGDRRVRTPRPRGLRRRSPPDPASSSPRRLFGAAEAAQVDGDYPVVAVEQRGSFRSHQSIAQV